MKRCTVPRLQTQDIVFSIQAIDISLRQFLCLLTGVFLSANCWLSCASWRNGGLLELCFWGLFLAPLLLALLFGWGSWQGQPLEVWGLLVLRFWLRPRHSVWRPLTVSSLSPHHDKEEQ
ncbi:hypothetical protein EI42_05872 [Thermosporothrix hazakensis]|jgi:hypothetical protein|uniref:PrgI family protein n=2 Tax=Thermosporothrix TaxID=768650 RepID=A0A326TVD1_THEHA|nr:hypothetical protein [Thermosporothrix hazakensis]PZW20726.1 hypothetical protein EI42_05872 [Thermosporothrix hazakensis]BBH91737.1 hypothetical protein KTC_64880 [Thermosporothrix sp. COM3]GCE49854.1 hypothetical protein KTH_47230 [Thermosporothrix hazakensis]